MRYSVPRKARRVPLGGDVHLKLENVPEPVAAHILNISLGGMSVALPQPAEQGSLVAFEMDVAETLVEGTGEVVWVRLEDDGEERPAGMGVRFRYLSPGSRERIFRLVQWFARNEGASVGQVAAGDLAPAPHRPASMPLGVDPDADHHADPLAALGPPRPRGAAAAAAAAPPVAPEPWPQPPFEPRPAPAASSTGPLEVLRWDESPVAPEPALPAAVTAEPPDSAPTEHSSEPERPSRPVIEARLFSTHAAEPGKSHRLRAALLVLAVVALGAAGLFGLRWLQPSESPAPQRASEARSSASAPAATPQSPIPPSATPQSTAPQADSPNALPGAEVAGAETAGAESGASAEPVPGPVGSAPTAPTAAAEPAPSASLEPSPTSSAPPAPAGRPSPASLLQRISHERGADGTVVSIVTDGDLPASAYSVARLDGANPRILIRIRGIRASGVGASLAADTPELARIRTGLHGGGGKTEVHVVLDLRSNAVAAGQPESIEGGLRLLLRRR